MIEQSDLQSITKDADAAYSRGEYHKAAELYGQVTAFFSASGNEIIAAEMANNHSVALLKAGDATAALQVSQGTDEIFAGAGDKKRQAMALGNQAAALEALHQYVEAENLYQKSADLLNQIGEHELLAYVLKSRSSIQLHRGKRFEAVYTMYQALEKKGHLSLMERILKSLLKLAIRALG